MAAALLDTVNVSTQKSCRAEAVGMATWFERVWAVYTAMSAFAHPCGVSTQLAPRNGSRTQHPWAESSEQQWLVAWQGDSGEHDKGGGGHVGIFGILGMFAMMPYTPQNQREKVSFGAAAAARTEQPPLICALLQNSRRLSFVLLRTEGPRPCTPVEGSFLAMRRLRSSIVYPAFRRSFSFGKSGLVKS
jgi:hypothetical protein